jgi:tryptophan synthase alpha chain
MGTTGVRDAVSGDAAALVQRVRQQTKLPVSVGLGVRDRVQAAQVAGFADGVIVGSAFVQRLRDAGGERAGIAAVSALAEDLAAGVREGTRLPSV